MKQQIVIAPTYASWHEWIAQLPVAFDQQGTVIYDARNQIRLIAAPDGREVCVKRFHAPRLLNRWIYSFLRLPKAVRAYNNAVELNKLGVHTPEAIAYILITRRGLLEESFLVTKRSMLTRNMYEFRHHPVEGYESVIQALARFTSHMHEQGILHKDYSPGNILFDVMKDGSVSFDIVDINRVRFSRPVSCEEGCHNFCRLWGKEDFFILLASEYAKARGFDERECVRLTLKYWRRFWAHRK